MDRRHSLYQVDVFTDTPLAGNPLAVFPDGVGLDDAEMQQIAGEMNLSETTFVLPPEHAEADYRVRIFTPRQELPFAGHPTLGTAHVALESGLVKGEGPSFTLRQQTLAGIQPIEVTGEEGSREYTVTLPVPSFVPGPPLEELCAALRIDPSRVVGEVLTVSVGVSWHVLPLASLEDVRSLDPDMGALAALEKRTGVATTVFCRGAEAPECSVRVRSFAPGDGIPEDPVCGSGNGCVGAYQAHTQMADTPISYLAEQGVEMGRPGRATVRIDEGESGYRVRVGGRVVTLVTGQLSLPGR